MHIILYHVSPFRAASALNTADSFGDLHSVSETPRTAKLELILQDTNPCRRRQEGTACLLLAENRQRVGQS